MINEIVLLDNISFLNVLYFTIKGFKFWNIVILIISFIFLVAGQYLDILGTIMILFVYFFGILISYALHEYMHIWWIKKLTKNKQIRIIITPMKFVIKPLIKITGINSIVIAVAGPISCVLVGTLIFFIREIWWEHNLLLLLLGGSYWFHIICFWPLSGDGLVIVKGIIETLKGGENNV